MSKATRPTSPTHAGKPREGEEDLTRQMAARRRLEQYQEERRLKELLRESFVEDGELW